MESSGSLPMSASFGRAEGWGISLRLCRIRPNRWLNFGTLGCDREWDRGYPMQLPKIFFTWRTPFSSLIRTRLNFHFTATATAKSLQSCPTLSDPMDCRLPGSSVHGIFQTGILEWVAIAFSELPLWETLNTEGSGRRRLVHHLDTCLHSGKSPFWGLKFSIWGTDAAPVWGFLPYGRGGPRCKAPLWRSIPGLMVLESHFWGGLAIWFLDFCASRCHLLCFWWLPIAWFDLVCWLWFVHPDFWH